MAEFALEWGQEIGYALTVAGFLLLVFAILAEQFLTGAAALLMLISSGFGVAIDKLLVLHNPWEYFLAAIFWPIGAALGLGFLFMCLMLPLCVFGGNFGICRR